MFDVSDCVRVCVRVCDIWTSGPISLRVLLKREKRFLWSSKSSMTNNLAKKKHTGCKHYILNHTWHHHGVMLCVVYSVSAYPDGIMVFHRGRQILGIFLRAMILFSFISSTAWAFRTCSLKRLRSFYIFHLGKFISMIILILENITGEIPHSYEWLSLMPIQN